jgi:hypothetical protein
VPLSDHEQKLLEQMEQALASEDPRFASQMRGAHVFAGRRRRWFIGGVGVLLGLGLVLVAVSTTWWFGAAGFALMVASAAFALAPARTPAAGAAAAGGPSAPSPGKGARKPGKSGFMSRLDERWERREHDKPW